MALLREHHVVIELQRQPLVQLYALVVEGDSLRRAIVRADDCRVPPAGPAAKIALIKKSDVSDAVVLAEIIRDGQTMNAGADYERILYGMKHNYARAQGFPGAGLAAGPCLLKDTMQLAAFEGGDFGLGYQAMLVNEGMPQFLVDQISAKHHLAQATVGLLGMAFKAESDDIRSSLSYKLKKLLTFKAKGVLTADPYVRVDQEILPVEEVVERSDILILCVPHQCYRNLDTKSKCLVDIWNFWRDSNS